MDDKGKNMDILIEEAEKRWQTEFQHAGVKEPRLMLYGDSNASFRISALGKMDGHLVKDSHFQEMARDIEKYSDPAFVMKAGNEERFYTLVTGILKGLIRECMAYLDPYERKMNIERVYNWYREKRKSLLDFRLSVRTGTPGGVLNDSTDASSLSTQSNPHVKENEPEKHISDPQQQQQQQRISGIRSSETPATLLPTDPQYQHVHRNEEEDHEKRKQASVKKKLEQYSRRNLKTAHMWRAGRESNSLEFSIDGSSMLGHSHSTDNAVDMAERYYMHQQQQIQQQQLLRQQQEQKKKQNTRISKSTFMHAGKPLSEKEAHIHKLWLTKRAKQAEEELEEMEFRDTVTMWSFNKARIEEEIHRRQESSKFSSQSGVRVHKIIRSLDLNSNKKSSTRPRTTGSKSATPPPQGRSRSALGPSSGTSIEEAFDAFEPVEEGSSDDEFPDEEIEGEDSEDETEEDTDDDEFDDQPFFLSPYSNSEVASKLRPRSQETLEEARGFRSPHPYTRSQRSLFSAESKLNGTSKAQRATLTPTPATNTIRVEQDLVSETPISEPGETFKLPQLSSPSEAPSQLRNAQLEECERIRQVFAKNNIPISTTVIQRAILIPEDMPFEVCVARLPTQDRGLINDIIPKAKRKTAKKGAKTTKKKGKKGGGKKKKKGSTKK